MISLYCAITLMLMIACGFIIRWPINKAVLIKLLFMIIFSLSLYHLAGSPKAYREYLYITQINQLIIQLQAHLQKDPNSREGWYLLGKLYLSQNRPDEAAEAFKRAG